ncbi:hypothetical protein CHGG_04326 [Chaetomium globosum CBS 148.51]|uniref:Glucose-methanol-choline oxidoreductase N-terminal domain-containing protein n=1 Tax=Chaetomium globosum (strain ATCC 6205 / CBS 148.51 / DSM 1962 / NBRC 6347 / NRRL 1970) TaxID=306901 RepID=Q2H1M0_CHAGB|nr:uncharacterized protein CHGG_04326 [Chaetomium globosum CBS 148.51]EAQ87707.1 hypothetical protein CHGG_04326 [Chaetomium globosum CBS 148.51]
MRLSGSVTVSLAALASAHPGSTVKRQASQLRDSYDFVIVGGGTSGLTVADRLTAAFPKKTVLVVEYGEIEFGPGNFDPPPTTPASQWKVTSLPNPEVNNKTALVSLGQVVGGSTVVNGQFLDRGSRFDYDSWQALNSQGSTGVNWNWDTLFPYFKKVTATFCVLKPVFLLSTLSYSLICFRHLLKLCQSVTLTEPSTELVEDYGYTWDVSAYGGSTPVYATYPPFQWADQHVMWDTYKELGVQEPKECANGNKEGICWVPTTQHPVTALRSHARLGHYAAVIDTRPNYDLLVKHQGVRVVYPKKARRNAGPPIVEVRSLADDNLFNVTAKAEVIISAGAIHTPTVLMRSGIGPASVLESAGIPLVLDLPGVGSNFQDHTGPSVSWNLTTPGDFHPVPSAMDDTAFAADAAAGFNETPSRGPYTLALANSAAYVSLPHLAPSNHGSIITKIRAIAADAALAASYLPPDHRTSTPMIAGYQAQLSALADLLANAQSPSIESPFWTGASASAILLHPLSRGTVRLDPANPLAQPILDSRAGTNPVDFDLHLAHVRFLRRAGATATLRRYGAVEVAPGAAVDDADDDALRAFVRDSASLSFNHPCCTAAMLPEEKGGVVGTDLKVHGAGGRLRVVDISVLPLVPGSHLMATAYAVGERAAELIIREWK